MKFRLTALVAVVSASAGVGLGFMIPRPIQTYGMAVVTGTTKADPVMKGYVEKVDALMEKWGCQ